jgi:polyhydroxybutyrate depolymerase
VRKTAWWVLLLALLGLAVGCKEVTTTTAPAAPAGACANPKPAPTGPITITSGGLQRTYLLALPTPLPTKPAPVIVNLHGAGSNKEQQAVYSDLAAKGPERGFVVVTPDATGQPRQWNVIGQTKSDDLTFINDLLTDLKTRACIDGSRLYATGISSGAAMSSILACKKADRFRVIAPVDGVVFFPWECTDGPPVSVIAFHGTKDPILPFNGGPIFSGGGATYPGAPPAMDGWAERGGCSSPPETEQVSPHVTLQRWAGCAAGTTVELYVVVGGGHTWPGAFPVPLLGPTTDEINATDIILDAFSQ